MPSHLPALLRRSLPPLPRQRAPRRRRSIRRHRPERHRQPPARLTYRHRDDPTEHQGSVISPAALLDSVRGPSSIPPSANSTPNTALTAALAHRPDHRRRSHAEHRRRTATFTSGPSPSPASTNSTPASKQSPPAKASARTHHAPGRRRLHHSPPVAADARNAAAGEHYYHFFEPPRLWIGKLGPRPRPSKRARHARR